MVIRNPTHEMFERAVRANFNGDIISSGWYDRGANSTVFSVGTKGGSSYVIKIPRVPGDSMLRQAFAFSKWGEKGVPVPSVMKATQGYSVEEKIDGIVIADADFDVMEVPDKEFDGSARDFVLNQLGKVLKKMHWARTKGFGPLVLKDGEWGGKYSSWGRYVDSLMGYHIDLLKGKGVVEERVLGAVEDSRAGLNGELKFHGPRILHSDFHLKNAMIDGPKVVGIIDGADAMAGDPNYDLGYFLSRDLLHGGQDSLSLLRGYGLFDPKKVEFYAGLVSLRKLGAAVNREDERKIAKESERLRNIVDGSAKSLIEKL